MQHQLIEVNKLEKSPQNARRTVAKGAAEDLKASILAHGVQHNLVVTAGAAGRYLVLDGGRRLEALRALQAEGKLPADHEVLCLVRGADDGLEASLAANTVRLAMHPADEFEAFARLIEAGATVDEVAARFGKPAKYVEQRLRLGRAGPKLLQAYRAEELTLEGLMAFALTDDRKRQMKVYRALKESHALNPRTIRAALTEAMAEAGSKLARFVGLDAYRAAGGTTQSDLFSEAVYLENPELLNDLAAAKLDAVRQVLEAEGWGWVIASPEYDWEVTHGCERIYPQRGEVPAELAEPRQAVEQELEEIHRALEDTESDALIDALDEAEARLAEIDEQIAALAVYDPDHVAVAGCYVSIAQDGSLRVEKGLVRKQDRKRLITPDAADAGPEKPKGLPETLKRDLEAYRLQVSQAEIARHRLIALDLLIFTAASHAFHQTARSGPDVLFRTHPPAVKDATVARQSMSTIEKVLARDWLKPKTEAERFRAFTGLADTQKLDLLAWCVAGSLQPQFATGREATAYELALSLTEASVAAYWRPTAANYLGRITRDQLLALGREVLGDQWAQARAREKKGELAAQLERAFAAPEKHARNPQQLDKLTRWLPEGMAFTAIAAEQPKAIAKAKKTARKAA